MIQTVTMTDFHQAFVAIRPDNFTYAGRKALFEFFENLEQETGEQTHFDVISLCCEFTEYQSIDEYNEAYGTDHFEWGDVDDTLVIPVETADYYDAEPAIVQNH